MKTSVYPLPLDAVLAREVAASLDLPVLPLLRRHAAEPLSRGADLADRVHSARSSFRAACEAPARVLLVDDVTTTGATANEAARTLLLVACGLIAVAAIVVAPIIRRDRIARFWAFGAVVAIVPIVLIVIIVQEVICIIELDLFL